MSKTFREALAEKAYLEDESRTVAAIFAMPEMEAIREALRTALDMTPMGCPYLLQDGSEGAYGPNTCTEGCSDEPECVTYSYPRLPKSVIDWVMEGEK